MLSINSKGRLVQKVNDIEIIYDLTTLTQELMFFKIDTVRVAIEMLRNLGFIYNEGEIICIITIWAFAMGSLPAGWWDNLPQ
ncbi:MAG: hypothetical protein FWE36_00030 [Erysipelotrichales bacterium]|nr:hypothetical protein [Erysipelotrichales bacterium]